MSSTTILIVDGSAARRQMMGLALQDEGHTVVEASDGKSARSAVEAHCPALVLLDVKLPDVDGVEVVRGLRALAPELAVIAVTGWAQADQARLLKAGFLDVLVRPVDASVLVDVVRRHVGRVPRQSRPAGGKIILAEDDPTQRKLAQLVLTQAGFDVILAEDGEAALRLAAEAKPDAILSDVLMPRMDGYALCKAIRSDPALAAIPIVLMSAHYLEPEDRQLAARFGAGYVSRTGGFDNVVRALLDALDGPVPAPADPLADESEAEHLHRIAHQLERQAQISVGLVRHASLQASALSVLDALSDSLACNSDPEAAIGGTLARCLDAAGLPIGAVFLRPTSGHFILHARIGMDAAIDWGRYSDVLEQSVQRGGLAIPSEGAGPLGDELLVALGTTAVLIAPMRARNETLGVLLLASSGDDLSGIAGEVAVRAARSVATQLGQALALSQAFAKVRLAEQRYHALLESAHDAVAITTREGVPVEVNRRMEELLGQPREQVVGRFIGEFSVKGGSQGSELRSEKGIAFRNGSIPPAIIARPDGSEVHVEFSLSSVDVKGESYILCVGRDVTERLRLEEQLRQSQKMEAVGRLAGGVAHDFNNVLSVILSYSELLLGRLKPNEPMRGEVEEVRKAGNRAAALTRQLLMFSRQKVVETKVLDLNEVLASVESMLHRILGADVDFAFLPAAKLGRVRADPGSVEQLIMNLVVNARDAMPTGGKLTIETANVTLDNIFAQLHHGAKTGPHVMLSVTDTGIGIDRATQSRMFEPFYTTKGVGKGTGLGLSTVFGIVQQSGGSVWVYSEPGHGATFKIYLPSVDAVADPAEENHPSRIPHGTETILLVEDDDMVRAVARTILQANGYHVLEACNAGEALLFSESYEGVIHLLLTDVVMPKMGGPLLAKRLAPLRPTMRVLCMSGYTDDSIVRHGVLESSLQYLQKPFTPIALTTSIRKALDGAMPTPHLEPAA